jgi:Family of unknown function (DUF5681)
MADNQGGYANPPVGSRFRKGQSGNPGGRPKKLPNFPDVVDSVLGELVNSSQDAQPGKITKQLALARALVAAGLTGDARAITAIIALSRLPRTETDSPSNVGDEQLLADLVDREIRKRETETSNEAKDAP